MGLDQGKFAATLQEHRYAPRVDADVTAGQGRGIHGSPAIVINDKRIDGVPNAQVLIGYIEAALAGRPVLDGRSADTTESDARAAFAVLAPFRDGSIFAGSFSGDSPWERHRKGDELVHILAGAATLTIMTADGPQSFEMTAGMLIVVPEGHWHRFHAPGRVTVLTATPQPTDHTVAEDPRTV